MGKRQTTPIDIVEVAYRAAAGGGEKWLMEVLTTVAPMLDQGLGAVAYEYDTNRPCDLWMSPPLAIGGSPRLPEITLAGFHDAPFETKEWLHRRAGPISILSELLGPPGAHADMGPHFSSLKAIDFFGLNATDPSGRGAYFCALSKRLLRSDDPVVRRWERVTAHLAAAGRLRNVLAGKPLPEAVIAPDGRVIHATRAAEPHLGSLSRAGRSMDRARVAKNRLDPEALASWRALVEGRWSLVEEFESDGRRFLFAHPNEPETRDPRRLTAKERLVAGYVAMCHSNKLIAYELGLTLGTVSHHIHRVMKKLGVRTRVEIVDRVQLLASATTHRIELEGEPLAVVAATRPVAIAALTESELAVAKLAVMGHSNHAIAKQRRVSPRTIANQLASVFAKLGVHSRSELAGALSGA